MSDESPHTTVTHPAGGGLVPRLRARASPPGSCVASGLVRRLRARASPPGSCVASGLVPRLRARASPPGSCLASGLVPRLASRAAARLPSLPSRSLPSLPPFPPVPAGPGRGDLPSSPVAGARRLGRARRPVQRLPCPTASCRPRRGRPRPCRAGRRARSPCRARGVPAVLARLSRAAPRPSRPPRAPHVRDRYAGQVSRWLTGRPAAAYVAAVGKALAVCRYCTLPFGCWPARSFGRMSEEC
ncbi:hypothetical protein QF030_001783 [Streptomyces rishiriensis]|uniref:Uncharacterized protein n=1 Tax=Streptomyces rishiriensis TaxID=68264 RepID=A0ABU0NKE8_STRRH|nr:hypothetical protein [Streptomyces rishiriensis]